MPWTPYTQRRTPIIEVIGNPLPAQQVQLRPVYYNLVNDLLGGLGQLPYANGCIISATPEYQAGLAPTAASGFYYGWNFTTNDDPLARGGFYHGNNTGDGFYHPLLITGRENLLNLFVAGCDPNNDIIAYVQLLQGQT